MARKQAQVESNELAKETARPTPSSAAYRRLIVEKLATSEDGTLTIQGIERAVGQAVPSVTRDPIEEEVKSLLDWGLVERVPSGRRYRLSDSGQRFWTGIQALARA